jgi:hypothetical protein
MTADTKRPAGYISSWRPHRKSQIMLGQVQQILEEYAAHLPITARQVYYRMIGGYRHPKGAKFQQALGDLLTNARRAGEIPFESIRDDGIMGGGYWPPDLRTFLHGLDLDRKWYRPDRQLEQDVRLEVWCEAAGMLPQLQKVADDYSIPVYSCGGFNSLTAIRQIVDSITAEERDTVVLHLGDYDPSGVAIFERVVTDVSAFIQEDAPGCTFEGVRVALTEEQIIEHALPLDPITTRDSRSKAWIARGKTEKCELEALPPDVIAATLRETIEELIDPDVRDEAVDRERLGAAALKSLPSGISYLPALREQIRHRPLQVLYPSPANAGGRS